MLYFLHCEWSQWGWRSLLPHEFWRNPLDSDWNVGIPWNSDRIHLAGASAILVFHSMEFPTESNRIQQNPVESVGIQEPLGMVSIGIHWNVLKSIGIPWIPMFDLPLLLL